eukprot:11720279-Karenia_brevis.AAC.1
MPLSGPTPVPKVAQVLTKRWSSRAAKPTVAVTNAQTAVPMQADMISNSAASSACMQSVERVLSFLTCEKPLTEAAHDWEYLAAADDPSLQQLLAMRWHHYHH